MYLMGIDVGTSGCKVRVVDEKGKTAASAYRAYSVTHPKTGWMELDAEHVFASVCSAVKECSKNGVGKGIAAIAVSTQGEAVIPVSSNGYALHPAIVTFDTRNKKEFEDYSANVDKITNMKLTGAPVHPMFSLTKILWFKNNKKDIFDKTWKFLCFGDFISMRLGAEPCIDYSMAARTLIFDINRLEWSNEILDLSGLSSEQLPKTVPAGEKIGVVSAEAASALDVNFRALIIAGSHDQICCALGAGVTESGVAMDSLGTTESILSVNNHAIITSDMIENNIPCYPYAIPGFYASLTFLSCSGSVLDWYKNSILKDSSDFSLFDKTAATACSLPTGLFVLPHFAGSGTPYLDFNSYGIISGITLGTSREQIYKAIIEGTCYEMKLNLQIMEKSGIVSDELRAIGGGAKSDFWMQIKADITGKKITVMATGEAGSLGAAMLAAKGCGMFKQISEPACLWPSVRRVFTPDFEIHGLYNDAFERYNKLYLSRI